MLYTLALNAHFIGLAISLLCIILADREAIQWLWGKRQTLSRNKIIWLHRGVALGLSILIVSGVTLFWPIRNILLSEHPLFILKMGFVATLMLNGIVIGRLQHIATEKPFVATTTRERVPLFISGVISTGAWVGAIITALIAL